MSEEKKPMIDADIIRKAVWDAAWAAQIDFLIQMLGDANG